MTNNASKSQLDKCKLVLEDFLLNTPWLPICSPNSTAYLDRYIADYLVKKGYDRFLVKDISFGLQVGGLSERALIDFARSERVFDGKAGRYQIRESYGEHSERSFQAVPA